MMNKFILTIALSLLTLAISPAGVTAASHVDFNSVFADRTLRLDYIFSADSLGAHVVLGSATTMPGWSGRTHYLDRLPYSGDGTITMTSAVTGDTIYRHSFSSLFNEWLSTPEAKTTPKGFSNTFLVPQPKEKTDITITVTDQYHRPIASMSHLYDPADILVRPLDNVKALPYKVIHRGSAPNPINVAFLAEGYTDEQMDSFYVHAARGAEAILSYEPFKSMADRFCFIAVASPSRDSGVSVPRLGDWKQTAFSSHFSTFYSDRYLTCPDVSSIHDALTNIPYEHVIILANTPEYGGGGIYNSYTLTSALHSTFRPVIVHEFGHSFGGLADEYFYDGDVMEDSYPVTVEPWNPNITTLVDFGSKWQNELAPGTPVPTSPDEADKWPLGVYEGGGYSSKGVYRPADQCRMRNNTWPVFCPACESALKRLIDFYTE